MLSIIFNLTCEFFSLYRRWKVIWATSLLTFFDMLIGISLLLIASLNYFENDGFFIYLLNDPWFALNRLPSVLTLCVLKPYFVVLLSHPSVLELLLSLFLFSLEHDVIKGAQALREKPQVIEQQVQGHCPREREEQSQKDKKTFSRRCESGASIEL